MAGRSFSHFCNVPATFFFAPPHRMKMISMVKRPRPRGLSSVSCLEVTYSREIQRSTFSEIRVPFRTENEQLELPQTAERRTLTQLTSASHKHAPARTCRMFSRGASHISVGRVARCRSREHPASVAPHGLTRPQWTVPVTTQCQPRLRRASVAPRSRLSRAPPTAVPGCS